MTDEQLAAKAHRLLSLHERGTLVLPNAWDAASAALIEAAGAAAIATTSGGVAWALGRTDSEGLSRTEMVEAVRRIAATVQVPVTADVEGGYGPAPDDVATTVTAVIGAGAVGANLEDSRSGDGSLYPADEQRSRLAAAREAAAASGLAEFVINARTDVYLRQVGEPAGRLDDVLARAEAYASAGADVLFVPGLLDLDTLATIVASTPLPINAMAGAGAPTVAQLSEIGVRRVSVGTAIAQAAYTVAQRAAEELLQAGTYTALDGAIIYPELNGLLQGRTRR
jgi:2-methylisocitrate lyase-like PEP mutase family enzyme